MPRWERLAVKAFGATDALLTVRSSERLNPRFMRVTVADGGFLHEHPPFPTLWLRLWFEKDGKDHQRAFTVVNARPEQGEFDMDFAIHDGAAAQWSLTCAPGDVIQASLLGSTPPWEAGRGSRRRDSEPRPGLDTPVAGRTVLVGDAASLPAINAMLPRLAGSETEVWLEHHDPADMELDVAVAGSEHTVRWIHDPAEDGAVADALLAHWRAQPPAAQDRFWISAEASATRRMTGALKTEHGITRSAVDARAYWRWEKDHAPSR